MATTLTLSQREFALKSVFRIARGAKTKAEVIHVHLESQGHSGRGECVPYARYGETIESVTHQIESIRQPIEAGITPQQLISLLPAGAARNAVDAALLDLHAKQSGQPLWQLMALPKPQPVTTAFTISYGSPQAMYSASKAAADYPLLKIKLVQRSDMEQLAAVRRGAPDARLLVDANEGWSMDDLGQMMPHLVQNNVVGIEQPLPAGHDAALQVFDSPIPLIADESVHSVDSLQSLKGRYDMVNIKLDKTGGLTAALQVKAVAQQMGFGIMVGCMVGSSLGMAPALLLAQGASFVDLDGPLLLADDYDPPLQITGSEIHPAPAALWG